MNRWHVASVTSTEGDWRLGGYERSVIKLKNLMPLLTKDRLENIKLDDIAWKGKHNPSLVKQDIRYKHADPYIPGIVAFNAPNPYNDKYRMIDGKHRIHKLVSQNIKESEFYVLDFKDIRPFFVNRYVREASN